VGHDPRAQRGGADGRRMVEQVPGSLERILHYLVQANRDDSVRRVGLWLGSGDHPGGLVSQPQVGDDHRRDTRFLPTDRDSIVAHQREGAPGHSLGLGARCTETPERQRDRDTLGQHDGSSIRDESRRTLATPQSSGTDDMVVSDSESLAPAGLVHSRIEQLDRGLSLETGIRPLRLVDLAPGVPSGIGGVRPLRQGEDRSVGDGTNEQVSQVRVTIPELQCVEDRRILVQMEPGTGLDVGVPTRGHGRQGALEGDRRTSQDDLDLAVQPESPMVVDSPSQIEAIELEPEDDPGSEPGVQPGGGQPPQPQPVRDEAVEDMGPGARRIGELRPDLPAGVVRTMSRGWARTTARVADRNWDLWISWCRDHQLDLERAPFDLIEANLLGFLDDYASRRNVSSATIAGIRSTFRRIT